ncbi:hypothetical protein GWK41_02020 [Persephonella atlantica]|uniref:Uncharacterized protein n=1 Tax=Persephonella atlantica TaxID=2699429 RepID=A0ABS1GGG2_9AQUI|nr:hypothetical protein [Persephonella atlantica]MBK3331842.1 hypothetical protein [Persephonella atlantica]
MFYHKQINTELLILMLFLLLFALIFTVDRVFLPDVPPPEVSIKINF